MAKLYNLARMTTATTGTGTITLGSAVTSYVTFADAGAQNGQTITYAIVDGNNREVGRGVYSSTGPTLTRATILESTNSNNAINLSGNAEVFITAAAEDITSSVEITGGSITGITDLAVADGGTGASDASTARTNLGLGTISTQAANNVSITGGSISGITDLAVADGGTGASSFTAYSVVLGGTTGTGALQNVSGLGTSGQVLTSNGTGAIPSWQSVAAGSTMEYIAHGVQSGTSAVSFTSIPSGYSTLYLYCQLHYANGARHRVALSSNNGSTYGTVRNIGPATGASSVAGGWVAISNVSASGSSKVITPSISEVDRLDNTTNRAVTIYTTTATETVVTGLINALQVTADTSGASSTITLYGVK